MVEALRAEGRDLSILASGINEVSADQHTESVLRTAAGLGVKRYRMAYYKYDLSRSITDQLAELKAKLTDLATLNEELGIQALYQNHAGANYVGATIWDICGLIEDLPRESMSLAFDIRHATAEATQSWATLAARAMPLAGAVYVKDCDFGEKKPQHVPLGQGRVSPDFFQDHDITNFPGPISLHVEYIDRKDPDLIAKGTAAHRTDLETLRSLLTQ